MRKKIFLFLSSRMFISDILHGPYIHELAQGQTIIVFLPKGETMSPDTRQYPKLHNVTYVTLPEPKGRFWTVFDVLLRNEFIRAYDDAASIMWRTRRGHAGDWRRRALRHVSNLFPKNFFSTEFFSFFEQWFIPYFPPFKEYAERYKPDLVMVCTPGVAQFDAYAILCAKRMGIPTVAFNFSWDNLTSLSRHVRKTDYLICWNNFHYRKAQELFGYSSKQLFVSGIPRFDLYFRTLEGELSRDMFLRNVGLNPARKTILFAARSHESYHKELIRQLIMWQKTEAFIEPVNIFVRVHPLDPMKDYEEFKGALNVHVGSSGTLVGDAQKKGQTEIMEGDWVHKKNTIMHSDVCLNVASTFSLEAFIFDKPVINLGFFGQLSGILTFPHYAPIVERGAVRIAMKINDVKTYINDYLENPSRDKDARQDMLNVFVMPTDGYSYKRNVDFIKKILEHKL